MKKLLSPIAMLCISLAAQAQVSYNLSVKGLPQGARAYLRSRETKASA